MDTAGARRAGAEGEPVKGRWVDEEAAAIADDVGLCAYASRLLGADPTLVLAGGGNSSVKTTEADVFGDPVEVLHVKGSGWDMGGLQPGGLAPLRLATVARLAELPELPDARMAAELRAACLDPAAPAPSVESILHAILPFRFVLHTHADAVLALTNTPDGEGQVREAYGEDVVVVPYVMPGFVLARACAEAFPAQRHAGTLGMVLLNHGLFTFADDARTAYENHLALVDRALARLEAAERGDTTTGPADSASDDDALDIGAFGAGDASAFGSGSGAAIVGADEPAGGTGDDPGTLGAIAGLRCDVSRVAGAPMILRTVEGDAAQRLVRRSDLATVTQVGPATPDHVLRTKRVPLVGRDVAGYARDYQAYVARNRGRLGDRAVVPVDPAPRVVLDPDLGALVAGRRVADAVAAAEIVDHTAWVIERAQPLGGYVTPSEADIFDVEYWELEQAKLARQPAPSALSGRVALVTGAASGIGRATAQALLAAGAAVVGVDLDDPAGVADGGDFVGVQGDATDPATVDLALGRAVRAFGGLDALVVNAGVFPPPQPLADLSDDAWAETLAVNAGGALAVLRGAHPFLRHSPVGGSVVVVASKNVPAPGPGAGAYSASKAALTQLSRVAALEWGRDGIRVNVLHPDAVFDTALWTDDLIAERAAGYGLTPEQYRRRNVLGAEVKSAHVASAVVALCGPTFARTTGAQIPVDGGNERVI
jgi:rhamnose utilization protein RhaD (predicted bifunctional aldolase and dehydrogenase)/NAD(P)-dependent dehydrogenase (short-subunit alcohol dehydrogenase family)